MFLIMYFHDYVFIQREASSGWWFQSSPSTLFHHYCFIEFRSALPAGQSRVSTFSSSMYYGATCDFALAKGYWRCKDQIRQLAYRCNALYVKIIRRVISTKT